MSGMFTPISCPVWCNSSPPASCIVVLLIRTRRKSPTRADQTARRCSVLVAVCGGVARLTDMLVSFDCFGVSPVSRRPSRAGYVPYRLDTLVCVCCVSRFPARSYSQQEQEEAELKKVCGKVKILLARFQVSYCILGICIFFDIICIYVFMYTWRWCTGQRSSHNVTSTSVAF